MRKANRPWILMMGVLVAVGGLGYGLMLRDTVTVESNLEPLIVTIGYGSIENAVPAPGALRASEIQAVYPPSTGEIADFHVEIGDRVEAGQLLATIKPDLQRDPTEVRAPISGHVVEIQQRLGAYVKISDATPSIMQIAVLDPLVVDTEVLPNDIPAIDDAIGVYFTTLGSEDRRWRGSNIRHGPVPLMSRSGPRYLVEFDVDNSENDLYPGMATQAFFVTSSAADVLTVPVGALTFEDETGDTRRATVEAVRDNGETETREVVVRTMDRVNAEVLSGLAEGDRVVAGTVLPPPELAEQPDQFARRGSRFDDRSFQP